MTTPFNSILPLPKYGGIANVAAPGMPVDECARLIARLAAVKKKCVFIAASRMSGAPEWELTAALGRWMWEDATQFRDLEARVTELRSSKSAIDKVLDYPLGDLLTEVLHAPDSLALCVGWFRRAFAGPLRCPPGLPRPGRNLWWTSPPCACSNISSGKKKRGSASGNSWSKPSSNAPDPTAWRCAPTGPRISTGS